MEGVEAMTRQVSINGPEIEREDGTVRCIGYGVDSEGRVTGRFALPDGSIWAAPDPTESVEYVDSMADLPSVSDDYHDGQ